MTSYAAAVLLLLACQTSEPAPVAPAATATPTAPRALPKSGNPAPDLALPSVEGGETWTLSSHLDPAGQSDPKGFVLAFMASWCTYCTRSLPTLKELQDTNPSLEIVTVTIDDSPKTQAKELEKVRAAGLEGPVLVADAETMRTWIGSGRSVPKYYFIDHNGVLVAKDDGFGDKVEPLMPKQAARALRD